MISNDAFAGAFGGGPTDDMARLARNAARAGFAVVPIEPGGKAPICPLTTRQAHIADLDAQAAGGRRHPCGINHATTDPALAGRWFARLAKERPGLNIGVEAGRSRMILVDADDAEAVTAWEDIYRKNDGTWGATATVLTPGRQLADGTWAHKDGAHYWYTLPEDVELDTMTGSMQLSGGVSVSWRDRQALVPPSERAEGPYRLVGKVDPAPAWLINMILAYDAEQEQQRAAKVEKIAGQGDDDIETWSADTEWPALLKPVGWTYTGTLDSCGDQCEIWTRPGEAGSAKSATAHDVGCTVTDWSTGWGPIHIWSDVAKEELGSSHLSKLQFYARTQHDGDTGAAMAAAGIRSSASKAVSDELDAMLAEFWQDPGRAREPESEPSPPTTSSSPDGGTPAGSKRGRFDGLFADLQAIADGTAEPGPTPAILTRTDGAALFYPRTLNGLFGEPEGGKTWVALAGVAEVINRGGSAAYLDVDGNGAASLVERIELLGGDWRAAVAQRRLVVADRVEDKATLLLFVEAMVIAKPDLVIIDALGDALPLYGAKTDSNDEVTEFLNQLARMAYAGTAVVTIDHVAKNGEERRYAIGAQAKKARMDGAYMTVSPKDGFARGRGGSAYINKAKDRHGHVAEFSSPRPNELWGTFLLEQDGGWAILPPAESQAEVTAGEHEGEAVDRAMVLVSAYLERLAKDAEELGSDDLAVVSAQAIRDAKIGVASARVQPTLNRLQDGGFVAKVARGRYPAWRTVKPYESLESSMAAGDSPAGEGQ
jgi:hypothetical protein